METVWPLVFDELRSALKATRLPTHRRDDKSNNKAVILDDEWELEYSWRDAAAHKLRLAVSEWLSGMKVSHPTPLLQVVYLLFSTELRILSMIDMIVTILLVKSC
jgi:hypothetical protein